MKNKFWGYIPYNKEVFINLWSDSVFVLDANILLNLYRYSEETKKIVLEELKEVSNRLWIPYNTAQEFFNNRLNVILDQKNIYKDIRKKVNLNSIKDDVNKLRHTTLSSRKEEMIKIIEECQDKINLIIDKDESNTAKHNEDDILEEILMLFDGKVGEKYSDKKIENYIKVIDERYKKELPPGFKDAKKNKEGRKYGDCINWFSIIDYAKENKKNIIYITDDNKEDWFLTINNKKYGPRMELLQEFFEESQGQIIYIYSTNEFIENFNKYLKDNTKVSEKVSAEIEEISNQIRNDEDILVKSNLHNEEEQFRQKYMSFIHRFNDIIFKFYELKRQKKHNYYQVDKFYKIYYSLTELKEELVLSKCDIGNDSERYFYSIVEDSINEVLMEIDKVAQNSIIQNLK